MCLDRNPGSKTTARRRRTGFLDGEPVQAVSTAVMEEFFASSKNFLALQISLKLSWEIQRPICNASWLKCKYRLELLCLFNLSANSVFLIIEQQKRRPIGTAFEIGIPIVVMGILILIPL